MSRFQLNRRQAGVTLTSYALFVSAFVAVSLGAAQSLETNSEDYLVQTGSQIGSPRPARQELATSVIGAPTTAPVGTTAAPTTAAPPTTTGGTAPPAFPPGDAIPPGVPVPIVVSGTGIVPGAVPTGITDPFDPSSGPYDSDFDTFVFFEKETVLTADLDLPGYPTIPAGTTVCSYFFHFSPADTSSSTPPTTYDFGNTVLATAHKSNTLGSTSGLGSSQSPSNQGFEGDPLNPSSSSGDFITVTGSQVEFENFAGDQYADNARVLTDCTPPPPVTPLVQVIADATLTGPWQTNPDGSVTSQGTTSTGAPSYEETATFTFVVPADGSYDLFGTVAGFGGSDDSFWVDMAVDGVAFDENSPEGTNCCNSWQWGGIPHGGTLQEDAIQDGTGGGGGDDVGPWNFTAGQEITVVVSTREDGTQLGGMELRLVP